MNKIVSIAFITIFIAASAYAEPIDPPASGMIPSKTKIEDLEKLVAEGKARKKCDGIYVLPDRFILNGKEHPKTQYGSVSSSQNLEYFLLQDFGESSTITKFFDKRGNLLWKKESPGLNRGELPDVLVSNKGNVFFLYGDELGNIYWMDIVDKSGRAMDVFNRDDSIHGVIVEKIFAYDDAQFAKNSGLLFTLAYSPPEQLLLLGFNESGKVEFFEKVNPSMKRMRDWYARIYFNPKRNQVLIDSSGIGEEPPMLSYWSFPQKKIFSKKTVKDEIIYNASFSDNDDILLLVKKKDGSKVVRRLSSAGKEKGDKSDISKMDAEELQLFREKPVDVRSLRGCENGDKYSPCR